MRAGVAAATNMAHEFLADDASKEMGAFLADEDELEKVGDAAAGLLSRRVPAGVVSPDFSDIVTLCLILGGYVVRQFQIRSQVKAMRAGAVASPVQPEPDYEPFRPAE